MRAFHWGLARPMLMSRIPVNANTRHVTNSLSFLTLGMIVCAVAIPLFFSWLTTKSFEIAAPGIVTSAAASWAAAMLALLAVRAVASFPGTRHFAYIIPAFFVSFGVMFGLLLLIRPIYSSVMLITAFGASTLFAFAASLFGSRLPLTYFVVPFGNALTLRETSDVHWITLKTPELPAGDAHTAIVADLHYDFDPAWERMLAAAAISGRAVYHSKQVRESLTGKVELEHLSENSFGSLLPNMAYRKLKRLVDIMSSIVALPLLALPLTIVAIAIRAESPGPALFRQRRMGYRGKDFEVFKFRTMRVRGPADSEARIEDAMTQADDHRITRLGKLLRRSRIDEFPQIWNVLRGEMSWIGPRPEAIPLSQWYERELPFYSYRHIVRPGITGWAQVNQGHVADLDSVHTKLHYDFYYIRNFSAWLDLLIVLRTVQTMLTGFGSK